MTEAPILRAERLALRLHWRGDSPATAGFPLAGGFACCVLVFRHRPGDLA